MATKTTCKTCRFFGKEVEIDGYGMTAWQCRRHPPVVVPVGNGDWVSVFPTTQPGGWCGECVYEYESASERRGARS